ncbi:hypothetical protein PC129_g2500 [Phytophthora cactorum]|uniref:Uncharacterized protein n=1 Tax=Phytophthora cactorum TaxID=29920 RepID=A0A329RV68_9STRA|nr:hypothetical protein Pcac1_g10791 [Phytophthora cactorum]KAG2839148.1 hypothetical protein PC112_g4222 [Phytophthora cactorum]KAG2841164.1 hypothetical protein PC111_g3198 [Phytophthora cactorum]KAG2864940.1 hypothetical protein PC113_g4118 [Phytophthora cactorum]KAG2924162.1 hypothetical protein PC114_g4593 [Phytophthora cactorum]
MEQREGSFEEDPTSLDGNISLSLQPHGSIATIGGHVARRPVGAFSVNSSGSTAPGTIILAVASGGIHSLPASSTSISQDLLLIEKKRKAKEEAVRDLNKALLEETLTRLRGKAQQLQNDKWMYQDVQL